MSSQKGSFFERHNKTIRWTAIGELVVGLVLLMRALPIATLQNALEGWVGGLGVWGPVVFGLVYIVATVLLIPASLLTLAGGAVFGLGTGFVTISLSSTVGAALAFLIARYLARSKVKKMAESNDKFGAIDAAISEGGWKIVAMLRLSPAMPFGLQNYLYGLTDIKFFPYVLTSWIAMAPGTLLYVYLGVAAKTATGGASGKSPAQWLLFAVGLAATLAVTVYVTKLARQKLAERTRLADTDQGPQDGASEDVGPTTRSVLSLLLIATVVFAAALIVNARRASIADYVEGLVGTTQEVSEES